MLGIAQINAGMRNPAGNPRKGCFQGSPDVAQGLLGELFISIHGLLQKENPKPNSESGFGQCYKKGNKQKWEVTVTRIIEITGCVAITTTQGEDEVEDAVQAMIDAGELGDIEWHIDGGPGGTR